MYTETCRPRRPFRPHTSVGTFAMFALFGLAPAAALADPPAVPVTATRSTKVPLADLDLDTPAGARVAYERIRRVAERLCDDRGRTLGAGTTQRPTTHAYAKLWPTRSVKSRRLPSQPLRSNLPNPGTAVQVACSERPHLRCRSPDPLAYADSGPALDGVACFGI